MLNKKNGYFEKPTMNYGNSIDDVKRNNLLDEVNRFK